MAKMPTRMLILIENSEQITKFVRQHPHLYKIRLLQYNGAKITKNTWVSDAVELDIDVPCQCYTYLSLFFIGLKQYILLKLQCTQNCARTNNNSEI